jgi:hypothetical protein
MVRVAVDPVTPLILTGLVLPKLKVGKSLALGGLDAITASSVTEPVNPPYGVTVIAAWFADVAPGETAMEVVEIAKGPVTKTEVVPLAAG